MNNDMHFIQFWCKITDNNRDNGNYSVNSFKISNQFRKKYVILGL